MRLALTVVSPATRQLADVLLDADPATAVAAIAAELDLFVAGGFAPARDYPAPGYPADGGARIFQFPGPRPYGSLAVSASAPQAQPRATPLYVNCQLVPADLSLAQSPLRDGSVISLGSPEGCVYPEPSGLVEIRVAGGPGAGAVHRLSLGETTIGSGPSAAIRLDDPQVPGLALHITVDQRGGCEVAAYQEVRAALEGEPLSAPVQWQPGQ